MKKIIIIFLMLIFCSNSYSSIKDKIIANLKNTKNMSFDFEQNTNGKIETGKCIIEYPKKILCNYNLSNNKTLVSDGKSLVIKKNNKIYYRYPIKRTPLNYILDKNFLLNKIENLIERNVDEKYVNFTILTNENEINLFFDKKNSNLIGWQTTDLYQNLNMTFLYSIRINEILKKNIFNINLKD